LIQCPLFYEGPFRSSGLKIKFDTNNKNWQYRKRISEGVFYDLAKLKTIIYIIEQPIKPSKKCDQEIEAIYFL